jgi:hypothetical protein
VSLARFDFEPLTVLRLRDGDPVCPLSDVSFPGRRTKVPSRIASKSRGTGGSRERHISDIDNRLRMSVLYT